MDTKPTYEELEQRVEERTAELSTANETLKKLIEERKRTEETLHAYEQIVSTITDMIFFLDRNYRYQVVNDAYLKAFPDKRREEIVGHTPADLIGEEDFKNKIKPDLDQCSKGKIVNYQDQFEFPGEGKRYMDVSYYPVFAEDGTVSGIVHVSRDITEWKKIERDLHDSQHMLQTVMDSIPAAVFWKDRDLLYLGGNRTFLAAVGLNTSEEVVGKNDYELPWDKEQTDSFQEYDRKVIESGIPEYDIIEPYLKANGTHEWAKTNKVPLRDSEGNIIGVLGTYEDITERKQAEEALRQSERELRIKNRIAETFLTIPDEEMYGKVLQVILEAFESKYGIFGYIDEHRTLVIPSMTRDIWEQCQVPDKTILYPRETWGGIWGQSLIEKRSLYANEGLRVPEGHVPIMRVLVVPIKYGGEIIGLLEVANKASDYDDKDREFLETIAGHIAPILNARLQRDRQESKRKLAEEALCKARDELELRVRERTAELTRTNELLQQEITERKLAEEALKESRRRYKELWDDAPAAYHTLDTRGIITQVNQTEINTLGYSKEEMLGKPIFDFILREQRKEAEERFRLKLAGEQIPKHDNRIYVKKDGSKMYVSIDDVLEYDSNGNVIGVRTTMVDVTERKQVEQALLRVNRALMVLSNCGEALIRTRDELEFMNTICEILVVDGGYRMAWVGLAEHDEAKTVRPVAQKGFEHGYLHTVNISWADTEKGRGPTGTAIRTKKPSIARNIMTDPHFAPWREEAGKRGYASSLALPLIAEGRTIGAINIYAGELDAFDTDEVRLLSRLAEDLSYGLLSLRTRAELRHLSSQLLEIQENERKRIAMELHDSVGQILAAIKFGLENAIVKLSENTAMESLELMKTLIPLIQQGSDEVRRIHSDLRPGLLDDLGIIATLSWFCREFERLYSGLRIEKKIDIEEKEVTEPLKIVIFRVVQEALNNVSKYAKADLVRLSVRKTGSKIELIIEDNGQGFDVEHVRSANEAMGGVGLGSMKERTQLSGGFFSIDSTKGKGTTVRASWPTKNRLYSNLLVRV